MPFYSTPQSIIVIDIKPQQTFVYRASGSLAYNDPCAAYIDGFVQDVQKYCEHVIKYGNAVELTENDILVLIIPLSFTKDIKLYLLNQLFASLKCYYIRLEYEVSIIMYSLGVTTGLVLYQLNNQMYQIVPYVKGRLMATATYATNDNEIDQQIETMFNSGLNRFAIKELKNSIISVQSQEAQKHQLKFQISIDVQSETAFNEGVNILLQLGSLSSECFVIGQNDQWAAQMN